ncbi:MAG: FkbM family methyltransferase [Verrucomicrobiota bacterium]
MKRFILNLVSTPLSQIISFLQIPIPILSGVGKGLRWIPSRRGVHSYWLGTYEPEVQEALTLSLEPGDVFWDIGAQSGFFSLLACRIVGTQGHVCSLDPEPLNIECQNRICQSNHFTHWESLEGALWSSKDQIQLESRGPFTSVVSSDTQATESSRTISALDIPSLLEIWPAPKCIKCDIEGAETDVFSSSGAKSLPKDCILIIEIHGDDSLKTLKEFAEDTGRVWKDTQGHPISQANPWGVYILAPDNPR